jgi:hypothetical protein
LFGKSYLKTESLGATIKFDSTPGLGITCTVAQVCLFINRLIPIDLSTLSGWLNHRERTHKFG